LDNKDHINLPPEFETGNKTNGQNKVDLILSQHERINEKASGEDVGRFKKLVNQVKLALQLIKDYKSKEYTEIPWRSIGLIAAAILYFLNPFDLVPDILPLFGFADDAVLFAAIFKSVRDDLEKYALWKGVNINEYF
jgi:uncharacterized membrane protein YkvA (DUF1232 family)